MLHNGQQISNIQRANLLRIVACWNAFQGIGTDEIERSMTHPAQAPVAFMYTDSCGVHYTDDQNEIWNGDGIESWAPLYAAPAPQSDPKVQTPLTGKQLGIIARAFEANDQHLMRQHWYLFVDFVREVEVAHGITGETK